MSAGPFSGWERAVAARYLRARRKEGGVGLISVIAFVGITLAVLVLIVVMSVMNGFRGELLSRILGFEGHAYVLNAGLLDSERAGTVARLKAIPQVLQAMPVIESVAMATGGGQAVPVSVRAMSVADFKATPLIAGHVSPGAFEGFGEGAFGGDLVLVGDRLAANLNLRPGDPIQLVTPASQEANPLGLPSVQAKGYIIGGTFTTGMSEYDSNAVLMPLAQAQQFFGLVDTVSSIEIMLRNPDQAAQLKLLLQRTAGPGAQVDDWTDRHASFFNALKVEHITMRLILGLLVVIAAMNIISGLVMLVKNKGRDIAILRTIGASRSAILRIFFMAGSIIGITGTALGVIMGVVISLNIRQIQVLVEKITNTHVFSADVYFLSYIPARVDWREVGMISLFSCLMAMACTLPPALRASRLDPVEALRYE